MRRENLYQKTKTKDKQTKKHKYLHVSYCHINHSKKTDLKFQANIDRHLCAKNDKHRSANNLGFCVAKI